MSAEYIYQLQPILEAFVRHRFVVFTSVIDEHIKRAVGQKELVRGVIDLLPAEVPDVQAKGPSVAHPEFVPVDRDAPGRLAFRRQWLGGLIQTPEQAGLAGAALTQDEHFGFVQVVHPARRPFTKVVEDGVTALIHDLGRWVGKGTGLDIDTVTPYCWAPFHRSSLSDGGLSAGRGRRPGCMTRRRSRADRPARGAMSATWFSAQRRPQDSRLASGVRSETCVIEMLSVWRAAGPPAAPGR